MNTRFRFISTLMFFVAAGLIGSRTYHYFFDSTAPSLSFSGVAEDGFYAGDVSCAIAGNDAYKVSDISIWLDGNPLVTKFKINSRIFEYPFIIPTKTLPNGKHTLKVEVVNGTYSRNKTMQELSFFVDNDRLQAMFVKPESEFKVFQGRTLHIQFQVNKEIKEAYIKLLSSAFPCFQESKHSRIYECFVPISCEESPSEYVFSIDMLDKVGNRLCLESKFQVILFPFKKSQLHIDTEKVKSEKELGLNDQDLEKELEALLAQSPRQKLWHGIFYPPIEIAAVTTEYGTIRTTQEKGRYVHKAVDIINTPGSVVWAPQDGKVITKNRYVHSGNTIVLDHGCGIFSLFFHLDNFADIAVGNCVKRGNPVGTLGKTGYASGYHLHWEMRIGNIPVDPLQWIKPNF